MGPRLNAILLLPVLVGLVLGGLQVSGSVSTWREAQEAERTARLVQAAAAYGKALIDERDRSAAPLLKGDRDSPVVRKVQATTDTAAEVFHTRAREVPDKPGLQRRLKAFEEAERGLRKLRENAYTSKLPGVQTEEGYVAVQHPLMEFANELGLGTENITSYGRTVYAVSLSQAAESLQRSIGMRLLLAPGPDEMSLRTQLTAFTSYAYLEGIAQEEYLSSGTEDDRYRLEKELKAAQETSREHVEEARRKAKAAGKSFTAPPELDDMVKAIGSGASPAELRAMGITPESWFAASTVKFDAYDRVEQELADKAVTEAARISADAKRDALATGAGALAALLAAFVIAGLVARSMSRSMQRLRNAAFDVAEKRLPAIVDQLSRTAPGRVDTKVRPIPISTQDEIGEVARAFDQVHREAVRLAAEQALLRGNVNAIFTNLSRRNQGLIERLLNMISELENNEADPDQLENLFRLDHLATRMRRNGENLLILAGEDLGQRWEHAVPLVDVLRAATSEVESYERVELIGVPATQVRGPAVSDLVHLLAELLENATIFSSPQTKVQVAAVQLPDGRAMIEIHDKGIGLTAQDFAEINDKLADPPTVDLAVSQRMGLFVVGRLAERHGIRVQLRPSSSQTGTTSVVMLPEEIMCGVGGEQPSPEEDFTVSRIVPEQRPHTPAGPAAARGPRGEPAFTGSPYPSQPLHDDGYGVGAPGPSERSAAAPSEPSARQEGAGWPGGGPAPAEYTPPTLLPGGSTGDGYLPSGHRAGGYPDGLGEPTEDGPSAALPQPAGPGFPAPPAAPGGAAEAAFPGELPSPYPEAVPGDPSAVDQQRYTQYDFLAHQDERTESISRAGRYESGHGDESESATDPEQLPGRVGFDRQGPSPSGVDSVTNAGLPRRDRGWKQPGEPDRSPESQEEGSQWRSPNDERWQRAEGLREPKAGGITSSGLPRRVPKANLVDGTAEQTSQGGPQVSRAPEDVRGRLSSLRRGVQQGRRARTDGNGRGQDPGRST
nr:nitrate- and nitrite sensing domain-containing protein [Streptomyces sp. TP-A0874]